MYTEVNTIDEALQNVKDFVKDGYVTTVTKLDDGNFSVSGFKLPEEK